MTKTSRSLLPEQHKQTNNLKGVYDKLRNSVPEGSTDNRQIVEAVHRILERYRTCEESTQDRRDAKLVNFIMDEFQALLKPYIDNYSKTVGLEDIIEEVLEGDDIQEGIVAEIKKVVKTSIKKLQVKTQVESTTVTQVIDQKDLEKQFAKNLDDIFDGIKNSKNPELTKYKKLVQNTDEKHTQNIVDLYKKSCKKLFDKISNTKNKDLNTRKQTKEVGVGQNTIKEKKPKNLVENTISGGTTDLVGKIEIQEIEKRQKNILVKKFKPYKVIEKKKNYFSFINEAFRRLKKRISRIFSPIFDKIKKIGGAILGPLVLVMRWTIRPLAKTVLKMGGALFKGIGLLGKGMIEALKFFRVDKLIKGVYHAFLDIGKMVGTAVKNTFLAFVMTPAGAYTVGFILGFLWGKLRMQFKKGGLISGIKQEAEEGFDFIKSFFDPYIQDVRNTFYFLMDNYVTPVVDLLSPIIRGGANIVKSVFTFALRHPKLVTAALALLHIVPPLLQILGPAKKVIGCAGGPLNALVAAGILAVAFGIPKIFKWRKDNSFETIGEKSSIYHKFNTTNAIHYQGMSDTDQAKYDEVLQRLNVEANDLDQVFNDLGDIRKVYKDSKEHIDFAEDPVLKDIVNSIFDSSLFGYERRSHEEFKRISKNGNIDDQIAYLGQAIAKRYNKLILMRGALSTSKSSKELSDRLNQIVTKDQRTGKYVPSAKVEEVTKGIAGDKIFQADKMNWAKLEWRESGAQEREMQYLIDRLEGEDNYYKTVRDSTWVAPGSPSIYTTKTEKVSAEEYFDNIKQEKHTTWGNQNNRYFRSDESHNPDISKLTVGIDGDNKDIIIEKLLSYSIDQIDELKNMSEKERQHHFDEMIKEWKDKAEERRKNKGKKTEEKVKQELQQLKAEKDYFDQLSLSCDNIIKGNR